MGAIVVPVASNLARGGICWLDLRFGDTSAYWANDDGDLVEQMPNGLGEADAKAWALARSDAVYAQSDDQSDYHALGTVAFPGAWRE